MWQHAWVRFPPSSFLIVLARPGCSFAHWGVAYVKTRRLVWFWGRGKAWTVRDGGARGGDTDLSRLPPLPHRPAPRGAALRRRAVRVCPRQWSSCRVWGREGAEVGTRVGARPSTGPLSRRERSLCRGATQLLRSTRGLTLSESSGSAHASHGCELARPPGVGGRPSGRWTSTATRRPPARKPPPWPRRRHHSAAPGNDATIDATCATVDATPLMRVCDKGHEAVASLPSSAAEGHNTHDGQERRLSPSLTRPCGTDVERRHDAVSGRGVGAVGALLRSKGALGAGQ